MVEDRKSFHHLGYVLTQVAPLSNPQNSNQKDLSAQQRTIVAAVINRVMQASTSVMDDATLFIRDSASDRAHMPQIGTHETRNTSAVSTPSRPIYDHHRNVVHE